MRTDRKTFEEVVASIDFEEMHRTGQLEEIGSELHYVATVLEEEGYPNQVATLAGIMDCFRGSRPNSVLLDDEPKWVARGFAAAMVRAAANGIEHPDDEEEK